MESYITNPEQEQLLERWMRVEGKFAASFKQHYQMTDDNVVKKMKLDNAPASFKPNDRTVHEPVMKWSPILFLDAVVSIFIPLANEKHFKRHFNQHEVLRTCLREEGLQPGSKKTQKDLLFSLLTRATAVAVDIGQTEIIDLLKSAVGLLKGDDVERGQPAVTHSSVVTPEATNPTKLNDLEEKLKHIFTHQIVYCGFPTAMNAFAEYRHVLCEQQPIIRARL